MDLTKSVEFSREKVQECIEEETYPQDYILHSLPFLSSSTILGPKLSKQCNHQHSNPFTSSDTTTLLISNGCELVRHGLDEVLVLNDLSALINT
jgi:hypothetical protein